MPAIRTVLHPTDFSESSAAAFVLACSLAKRWGARLVVLHVYPPAVTLGEVASRRLAGGPEAYLAEMFHAIRPDDPSIPVTHRLIEGRAADTILRTAAEEGADLIVVGTHGRSGLSRLLMGSVAEAVMRKAPCPVATARPSGRATGRDSRDAGTPVAEGVLANGQ